MGDDSAVETSFKLNCSYAQTRKKRKEKTIELLGRLVGPKSMFVAVTQSEQKPHQKIVSAPTMHVDMVSTAFLCADS